MDNNSINQQLALGELEHPSLFPHLTRLKKVPIIFTIDFGLGRLPTDPGIILIRGARQYGKSTWLEQQIRETIVEFGKGTAFYLNGENITDHHALDAALIGCVNAFAQHAPVKRIFIDEITAVQQWEISLKRLVDSGKLAGILVVTTGSKAMDLRRGTEKLPGRKGKLSRTTYLFTPIAYRDFYEKCHQRLGSKTLISYLLSGGSPVACVELATAGSIPEYVIELVRDWIEGEIAASGRNRISLMNIMNVLFRFGGTPVGQAKLAREAGLANNTVAAGYMEILHDLGCTVPAYPWDQHRKIHILRKPCKYHFTNLLAAVVYSSASLRSVDDFLQCDEKTQGMFYEWLVAQELLRRRAIQGNVLLEPFAYWANENHEIDFMMPPEYFIEVKRGKASIFEFSWFPEQFKKGQLSVISTSSFSTDRIRGISMEDFLLADKEV